MIPVLYALAISSAAVAAHPRGCDFDHAWNCSDSLKLFEASPRRFDRELRRFAGAERFFGGSSLHEWLGMTFAWNFPSIRVDRGAYLFPGCLIHFCTQQSAIIVAHGKIVAAAYYGDACPGCDESITIFLPTAEPRNRRWIGAFQDWLGPEVTRYRKTNIRFIATGAAAPR